MTSVPKPGSRLESGESSKQNCSDLYDDPPPYGLHSAGDLLDSSAAISGDGRIDIAFSSNSPAQLASLLPTLSQQLPGADEDQESAPPKINLKCPRLNLVIQVVGSRGDVQPFIAYGTALRQYGHRVRIATHNNFADFVRESGLEFYPIGGDPADLMAYMVRNPGLIPSLESLRGGDIGRKRRMIKEMLDGCWEACFHPDPLNHEPFIANAIIANPPSFAHVHCAQALGVPVHIMFTMPWTATKAFPHPLANFKKNNIEPSTANWLSYGVVEMMTWQGLGDVINDWRRKSLGLDSIQASMGPGITTSLRIPHTYCWSPTIIPKPADWGPEIDVCGFFMRDEPTYNPPPELDHFLRAGPPPVYVGFGSIVIDDPQRLTNIILEATKKCGVRVIISRGWSKLGGDSSSTDSVFYLGDCPHEWLFKRVLVVVHHGGAGTTACGLVNARPTIIVPFFGDQPFWGGVVASIGAGPHPIPHKELTVETLVEALQYCLLDEANSAAQHVALRMSAEKGVDNAVTSLHHNLPVKAMMCDALPQCAATWLCEKKGHVLKLSDLAAATLIAEKKLKKSDLEPIGVQFYDTDVERCDPLTGGASSVLGMLTDMTVALGSAFIDPFKEYKRHRKQPREDGSQGSKGGASGAAAMAAGKNIGKVYGAMTKGALLDLPLAFAEGLRNAPKLYGAEPDDYGQVKDWKSGTVVGGKALGMGLYNSVTGLVTEPYKGAKTEGTVGFLKGIGKGSVGFVTKSGTATFGIFAYPAQGVYKSIISKKDQNLYQQRVAARDRALAFVDTERKKMLLGWFSQAFAKK
ncbi:hypothetical protein FOVG_17953 [Fusarium oxysporum f. sp. pisi HDV247]|uniref:Uncharacterized protein n=1 Tax=Fusarium oxysporum f. sp. pisi HDV247 TaxID=1080344 RepID=W9ND42_FUSOX|nr:hypothetical protein FOVG_17953 [Fusarium oxysporum f. sp. pisi HDV247]